MSSVDKVTERVMKLEMALVFLVNSLRGTNTVPQKTLDVVEKIVTSGGAQSE